MKAPSALLFAMAGLAMDLHAQNLVLNPGFEDYVPDSINGGTGDSDVAKAQHWVNVGPGTSDYFHSDYNFIYPRVPDNEQGTQVPHGGDAYAGIYAFEITPGVVNVREYIRSRLTVPLEAGELYQVSFYASLADSAHFAAGFGANLSESPINAFDGYLMLAPEHIHTPGVITDKLNWTHVSGIYAANGHEEYLTIGGYFDDQSSDTMTVGGAYPNAYYYIDDVSVAPLGKQSTAPEEAEIAFELYPNPATRSLNVNLASPLDENGILLIDALGRSVPCTWQRISVNSHVADLAGILPGVYTVMIPSTGSARRLMIGSDPR